MAKEKARERAKARERVKAREREKARERGKERAKAKERARAPRKLLRSLIVHPSPLRHLHRSQHPPLPVLLKFRLPSLPLRRLSHSLQPVILDLLR